MTLTSPPIHVEELPRTEDSVTLHSPGALLITTADGRKWILYREQKDVLLSLGIAMLSPADGKEDAEELIGRNGEGIAPEMVIPGTRQPEIVALARRFAQD